MYVCTFSPFLTGFFSAREPNILPQLMPSVVCLPTYQPVCVCLSNCLSVRRSPKCLGGKLDLYLDNSFFFINLSDKCPYSPTKLKNVINVVYFLDIELHCIAFVVWHLYIV